MASSSVVSVTSSSDKKCTPTGIIQTIFPRVPCGSFSNRDATVDNKTNFKWLEGPLTLSRG